MMRSLVAIALAFVLLFGAQPARAHDFDPGVLVLVESGPGRFDIVWTQPVDAAGSRADVRAIYPGDCTASGPVLECASGRLAGAISFEGMHGSRMQAIVIVQFADGRTFEQLVSGNAPKVEIAPEPSRDARTWLELGVEHIVLGFDHLAFVAGLLLIVGMNRKLIATITAFTVAHSITLALAATGVVDLPRRSVEAVIAMSIVLVAREALSDRPTLARRKPWLVAGLFGLVHGLGFAGALAEVGLPRGSTAFALLFFNLGVEIGQLAAVAVAAVLAAVAGMRVREHRLARPAVCYAVGGVGAFWWVDRMVGIVTGSS
jgi:hydrogenase/urease accessory protein HupE